MENEQTSTTDTSGTESPQNIESNNEANGEPVSDYDKALELVKRREAVTKEEKEILERKERLEANKMLSGTGTHVEAPTPEQQKQQKAQKISDEIVGAFK